MAIVYTDEDIKDLISKACPALARNALGEWLETIRADVDALQSGGSSSITTLSVVQNNSYSNLQPVYWNGTIWALANSNAKSTIGLGIITNVTATGFTVNFIGKLTKTAHGLGSNGQYLYVTTTAGTWTTTEPTSGNSNPLAFIYDANTIIMLPYRASKVAINFSDLADGFALTGQGGKAVAVKSDVSGLEPVTMPVQVTVSAGTNVTVDHVGNDYEVNFSGAENPTNPFIMTLMTTDPGVAAAGTVKYAARTIVGFPQMFTEDENGVISKMRLDFQGDKFEVYPYSGSSLSSIGAQYSASTTPTMTHPTAGAATLYHYVAWLGSNTTANTGCQVQHRANCNRIVEGIYLEAHAIFKQATACRMVVGLTSDTNLTTESNSDTAATQFAGLTFSTSNGDSYIQANSRDAGGTRTRTATTTQFLADKLYKFYIAFIPNVSTLYWRIVNVTDGTDESGTKSTNIPDTTTLLRGGIAFSTTENVQKDLYFKELKIYGAK